MTTSPPHRIFQFISYNPDTGVFIRIRSRHIRFEGARADTKSPRGYLRVHFEGKKYQAHRLAWLFVYGEWPDLSVDHKNGNTADNRICNLRLASSSQNAANSSARGPYLKGVTRNTKSGRFQSQIKHGGRCYYLGLFDDEQQAHMAYVAAAKRLHGEFARAE